jgi:hypothetical protein
MNLPALGPRGRSPSSERGPHKPAQEGLSTSCVGLKENAPHTRLLQRKRAAVQPRASPQPAATGRRVCEVIEHGVDELQGRNEARKQLAEKNSCFFKLLADDPETWVANLTCYNTAFLPTPGLPRTAARYAAAGAHSRVPVHPPLPTSRQETGTGPPR